VVPLPLSLFHLENYVCLSRGVQVAGAAWCNEGHGRSMRPGVEDWGWLGIGRVLGGRMIERTDDAMYGLHHTYVDEEREFHG
jgi:hypothetical protein